MEFDYFSENYRNFEKTFNDIYAGEEPLTFISDDLLSCLNNGGRPFFVLPAHQAKDNQKHVFWFKIENVRPNDVYKFSHIT